MADGIIRVKAKVVGDKTQVKMMAKHIMETGQRKDKVTGETIPARYLQELTVEHADKLVFAANMSTPVSKNPYFSFYFVGGASGDELVIKWQENTGKSATEVAKIR
ncbi:thiosulfate oxidation carrier complex protein SoxZ [Pontibacter sp. JAM-7]|uniref:thiosulfate oxidation carrier complex protein SoxZ n=1 Tax=Pontibacter sp. JAM-7 TaxID=3366581 RepID=UPI003AF600E3